jgi:hypothetical protein
MENAFPHVYACAFVCVCVEQCSPQSCVCKSGGTDICIWWNIYMCMVEHICVCVCVCVCVKVSTVEQIYGL